MEMITSYKRLLQGEAESKETADLMRIHAFYENTKGKPCAQSFQVIREPKQSRNFSHMIIDHVETDDLEQITTALQNRYQNTVGAEHVQQMSLTTFLNKYNVSLDQLDPDHANELDQPYTAQEVREALLDSKKNSAPGPTKQTPAIFKFIHFEIPQLFTAALNEITFVPGFAHAPINSWMMHRHIVYIPKPNKLPNMPENLRPLSLLETVYKIQTKMLAKRMISIMPRIITPNQHGFMPNRSCQTATIPVVEALNDAILNNKPLQLLAVDISSAFDTIDPKLIREVMESQKYPTLFSDALHSLTGGGYCCYFSQQQV